MAREDSHGGGQIPLQTERYSTSVDFEELPEEWREEWKSQIEDALFDSGAPAVPFESLVRQVVEEKMSNESFVENVLSDVSETEIRALALRPLYRILMGTAAGMSAIGVLFGVIYGSTSLTIVLALGSGFFAYLYRSTNNED